ncbi:MAG: DEAD/DEAH box helicase [Oscillospiraceae bacterium]|jgi:ATP-dependent RNA helicase DeaD|nr:DEAD/DEAH box helicase [Oscillospiraceae bacterium]
MSQISFEKLKLSQEIQLAIDSMGFTETTEIQKKAIPIIIEGHDVLGKSQTGTGKTLAFSIPAIELIKEENKDKVQVLIICPTRELTMQATHEILKLSKFKKNVVVANIYGGSPIEKQIFKLKTSNIVVGTPGRIIDHLKKRTLKLNNLKMVVLDEADEMLSMGFREDIEKILLNAPDEKQTILFSATMPIEILKLTKKFQKDPKLIEISRNKTTVESICQYYYNVPIGKKAECLKLLLLYYQPKLSIVFCNTKKMVDCISEFLKTNNFEAIGLHGDMQQNQRSSVMKSFKSGQTKILVATDVAARGIDVNDVDYVVNFDIPQNIEYYVHRIGRTGRAGKSGEAITICSGKTQVDSLIRVCRLIKSTIKEKKLPKIEDILKAQYKNNLSFIEEQLKDETNKDQYHKMTKNLIEKGYDPILIASVVLKNFFKEKDKILKDLKPIKCFTFERNIPERNFRNNRKYTKNNKIFENISINVGKLNNVDCNSVVRAIINKTQLNLEEIGKIKIFDKKTLVEIPKEKIFFALKQLKNFRICGKTASAISCKF